MTELKQWVIEHLLTEKQNKLSARRINQKWFLSKGYSFEYQSLLDINPDLTLACKIVLGWTSTCKICDNIVVLPRVYCCTSCQQLDPDNKEKVRATMFERYGVETASQSKEIRNKAKNTMLKRYGVHYSWESKELLEKRDSTMREHYGEKLEKISQRIKKTNQERYGVDNPLQREDVKHKVRETNLERYGFEVASKSDIVKEKTNKTNLKRYGCHPSKLDSTQQKRNETNLGRYGCHPKQTHFSNELKEALTQKLTDISGPNDHIFGNVSVKTKYTLLNKHRPDLVKVTSMLEKEILQFVKKSVNVEVLSNTRKPLDGLELDIYIPDLNLAFEFNGNYWHSDKFKDKFYHQNKSLLCRDKGIRLIHLYEFDGLEEHKKIISNILTNKEMPITELNEKIFSSFDLGHNFTLENNGYTYLGLSEPTEVYPGVWNSGNEIFC